MSGRTPQHVAVLMGGPSSERAVSLSSGRQCADALAGEGFRVSEVDAGADLAERLRALAPDAAFLALHGRWGEDGCVQGMLEWLRLPYTHSGVLASALAMDKTRAKDAYRAAGLPVVESRLVPRAQAGRAMAAPFVVKPNADGSSVGVHIVHEGSKLGPLDDMPETVMVERYAPGRELTTTVLGGPDGDRALGVTEIHTDGWYDYDAKYAAGGSRHTVPAEVPAEVAEACEDFALRAHAALGCRSLSRTDFRWDPDRGAAGLVLLETNTQPGMTPTSLTPEQAAHAGIPFGRLCALLVEDASCDR